MLISLRISLVLVLFFFVVPVQAGSTTPGDWGKPAKLPLPASLPLQDYETVLYRWLMTRRYKKLGWSRDKMVRDTGPFVNGMYYGTHLAVRIYYSPEVMAWLDNDRRGNLPDGSMIVKEMFLPPAVFYQQMASNPRYKKTKAYDTFIDSMLSSWTVMIKDSQASKDGWFWANPSAPAKGQSIAAAIKQQLDQLNAPPASEFGAPCLRCHASAISEFTFSDIKNIQGYAGHQEPLRFLVDTSWRSPQHFDSYPLSKLKGDPYVQALFMLPEVLRPYQAREQGELIQEHMPPDILEQKRNQIQIAEGNPLDRPSAEFIRTFNEIAPVAKQQVRAFPSQWMDQVLPSPHGPQAFMTSDNCLGCHGGLGGQPSGVVMFAQTGAQYGQGYNLSEYGEWRWSPMGLAGRDPIFHAQLESEMALLVRDAKQNPSPLKGPLKATQQAVTNTCLSCHGAMGQRQLSIDAKQQAANPQPTARKLNPNFSVEYFYLRELLSTKDKPAPHQAYLKYGQLAREGISCAVCHHIDAPSQAAIKAWQPPLDWLRDKKQKPLAYALFHNNTGRFVQGPNDEFFGPFKQVAEIPMHSSLGVKPVYNEFISDSQLCGTCHTINLPNIGATESEFPILDAAESNPALKDYPHSIEQATFLEWQNSSFAQQPKSGLSLKKSTFKSCQDCHMPGGFSTLDKSLDIEQITTQIAAIQDLNYPEVDNRLPDAEIDVPLRDDYRRHEHVGLNVFLLEMFDQFPDILGVSKTDYMTSASNGVDTAIENMLRQGQEATANIEVNINEFKQDILTATVSIRNLVGHRFPSGVAFRRAFIEFAVLYQGKELWVSGGTNSVGVILDHATGQPLKTEFLPGPEDYQPHYQLITEQSQVQIYEELVQNAEHQFTTSFIHRVHHIKDNRLLPDGWRAAEQFRKQGELFYEFFLATDPLGTGNDPDYQDQGPDFKGGDRLVYRAKLPPDLQADQLSVRATLYSQSIPPYWLQQRFNTAPQGAATQRLYYMASRLNLENTAMANWKLKLVSDEKELKPNK